MTNPAASSPRDAVDVLRHVESVQREARTLLQAFWFPLVVFGAITVASAAVQWAWPGSAVGAFWAVAGPLGGIGVAWYYRTRGIRLGLSASPTPYVVTAVAILLGAFLLPMLTSGDLQEVVSVFAVAAGYLAFAWIDRSPTLAGLAVFMAVVPTLVLVGDLDHPGAVTAALTGAALLATGLASRRSA
jgi:hypothetical protein